MLTAAAELVGLYLATAKEHDVIGHMTQVLVKDLLSAGKLTLHLCFDSSSTSDGVCRCRLGCMGSLTGIAVAMLRRVDVCAQDGMWTSVAFDVLRLMNVSAQGPLL